MRYLGTMLSTQGQCARMLKRCSGLKSDIYMLGSVENWNFPWVPKICNHKPFEDFAAK